jgi:hypothetical protein
MKSILTLLIVCAFLIASKANAWEAQVTNILQHGDVAAITLSPDPGKGKCEVGSPYLIHVDDTQASKQLFSMLLAALTTGNKIRGYEDPCSSAIWGASRPTIKRLNLTNRQQ